jgi:hypothetical protein
MCPNNAAAEMTGIQITPIEVRLLETEDLGYSWRIKDASLNILFRKHLSKHSVRAYMRLYHEVGKSFCATSREAMHKSGLTPPCSESEGSVLEQRDVNRIQELTDENTRLAEELGRMKEEARILAQAKTLAENEAKNREIMLQEAQATIQFHQQDAQQWMAVAETYQASCIQCSDALRRLIDLAEGAQSHVSIAFPNSTTPL